MQKRPPEPEGALYVRLPAAVVDKIGRAAEVLGVHKKDLIAGLVTKYLDPDSKKSMSALTPARGQYTFQSYDPPEVMNVAQVAQFLQLEERVVHELAEAGKLPGRKLGPDWRFSRTAIVAWLAGTG